MAEAVYGMRYALPTFLDGKVEPAVYRKWLRSRTLAHVRTDKRRRFKQVTGERYRISIHQAVLDSNGRDYYTGERLDWSLLGKFRNEEAKMDGPDYLRRFALLPSVDHYNPGVSPAEFKICARRTNDAKSALTESEFRSLCRRVLSHAAAKRRSGRKPTRTV